MTVKTLLAALVVAAAPAAAFAMGCQYDTQVTMSCSEGTAWDAESQTCVPTVSS